tara:strand:- start:1043 stop:1231 length:189 start_codon:yes stop_codon:yes gene_type:complete
MLIRIFHGNMGHLKMLKLLKTFGKDLINIKDLNGEVLETFGKELIETEEHIVFKDLKIGCLM